MKISQRITLVLIYISLCSVSCSILGPSTPVNQSTPPFLIDKPTPMPLSKITLTVTAPNDTPSNAAISIKIFDEVSGWRYNSKTLPLNRLDDGRWQLEFTPPVGSLLRYRFLRTQPESSVEASTDGTPIRYRTLYITSTAQVQEIIAAWSDSPFQGSTGRIIGRLVEDGTGKPLSEMIVNVAGQLTFTDSQGNFRVEGLAPGLHTMTAFSPDGSYSPAQQGAIIAADSTTPVQMNLFPAQKIQVTFEVAIPEDTFQEASLRIAGNIQQFGHIFTEVEGGLTNTISQMPTMIQVDLTHYIQIIDLYAGLDLRYKYTIGDGLWNAERDAAGEIYTRQIILPDYDLIIRDAVERWQGQNQGENSFSVIVPPETPEMDQVSIQFKLGNWQQPLPMWQIGESEWFYTLYNLPSDDSVAYRYCRNQQCGSADDLETPGVDSPGRPFSPDSGGQEIHDTVLAWNWWSSTDPILPLDPPQLGPRPDFKLGIELLPDYHPTWNSNLNQGLQEISSLGANSLIFSPTWVVSQNHSIPVLSFDPAYSPFNSNLKSLIQTAQQNNLDVILHPTLVFPKESSELWWQLSRRDNNWWTIWFEQYKAFLLCYAQIAQEMGVSRIILGGSEITPALPEGLLSDGSPSNVTALSTSYWRELITDIRSIYSGRIVFELELKDTLQSVPPFIDAIDEIHIYWHAPLSTEGLSALTEMQVAARSLLLNSVLNQSSFSGKPITISVEYPSVNGGTSGCLSSEDGECVSASIFDQGAFIDPAFQIDLGEQAEAITAVLTESYYQAGVTGFFVRRYYPIVDLQDKSASINGKPCQEILKILYQRIAGQ